MVTFRVYCVGFFLVGLLSSVAAFTCPPPDFVKPCKCSVDSEIIDCNEAGARFEFAPYFEKLSKSNHTKKYGWFQYQNWEDSAGCGQRFPANVFGSVTFKNVINLITFKNFIV